MRNTRAAKKRAPKRYADGTRGETGAADCGEAAPREGSSGERRVSLPSSSRLSFPPRALSLLSLPVFSRPRPADDREHEVERHGWSQPFFFFVAVNTLRVCGTRENAMGSVYEENSTARCITIHPETNCGEIIRASFLCRECLSSLSREGGVEQRG